MLLWDPARHLALDHGGFGIDEHRLAMYTPDGGLSPMGIFSQKASKLGFLFLMCGLLWFLGMPKKLSNMYQGTRPLPL